MEKARKQRGETRDEDDEEFWEELEVRDTPWSGQAGLDIVEYGTSTWQDVAKRPILALGDVAALALFAIVGKMFHATSGAPILDVDLAVTAAPFILAWLLVAPLLGAYTYDATRTQGDGVKSLIPSWAVAMPLALGTRFLIKGYLPTPFIGASLGTTLVLLALWRAAYIGVNGGEKQSGDRKSGSIFDLFKMVTTLINRW